MTYTEDQFRTALRTVAADVTDASLPPLQLPDRGNHRVCARIMRGAVRLE